MHHRSTSHLRSAAASLVAVQLFALALVASVAGCSAADGSIGGSSPRPDIVAPDAGPSSKPSSSTDPTAPADAAVMGADAGGGDDAPAVADAPPETPAMALVKDLAIRELAIFQGVKVPLARDGAKLDVSSKVHVIEGREGILRVYVQPATGFSPREVTAELTLAAEGKKPLVLSARKTVTGASDDAVLDSTINIDVPSGAIDKGTTYRVRLLTAPGQSGDSVKDATFPAGDAFEPLDVWDTGDSFKVVLVPVKKNGYLPDTSPEQIERYRKILQAMYPVKKVEITLHAVYEYTGTLGAGGSGIYGLLDAITALRQREAPAKDVYYYGVFAPTSSYSAYCSGGCTTGLCHLTGQNDAFNRACVGVGFTGSSSAGTLAHELGHAHGIRHAPCGGVAGSDGSYPYAGGKIGAWGYDNRSKSLISPTKTYDFMSYCSPDWISDYSFDKITHRMSYIASAPYMFGAEPRTYRILHELPDGTYEWGSELTLNEPTFGEPREVSFVDETGVRAKVSGFFYPYADDGGSVLVPTLPRTVHDLRIVNAAAQAIRLPDLP